MHLLISVFVVCIFAPLFLMGKATNKLNRMASAINAVNRMERTKKVAEIVPLYYKNESIQELYKKFKEDEEYKKDLTEEFLEVMNGCFPEFMTEFDEFHRGWMIRNAPPYVRIAKEGRTISYITSTSLFGFETNLASYSDVKMYGWLDAVLSKKTDGKIQIWYTGNKTEKEMMSCRNYIMEYMPPKSVTRGYTIRAKDLLPYDPNTLEPKTELPVKIAETRKD